MGRYIEPHSPDLWDYVVKLQTNERSCFTEKEKGICEPTPEIIL